MAVFDPTQLIPLDYTLAESWRAAGAELGFRVVAPFHLLAGNLVFRYGALLDGFGAGKRPGLLVRAMLPVFSPDECGAIWAAARDAGYEAATLSPLLCHWKNREDFVTFLNFQPWSGPAGERPAWHVGPVPLPYQRPT